MQPSPKLVAEASSSAVPVTRPHTPTPSLPPDYESSQAQLRPTTLSYPQIQEKRTRRRRCRRYTIYALAAYFFLTLVVGVPILVVVRPSPLSSFYFSLTIFCEQCRNSRKPSLWSNQIPISPGRTTRPYHPIPLHSAMRHCGYHQRNHAMLGM